MTNMHGEILTENVGDTFYFRDDSKCVKVECAHRKRPGSGEREKERKIEGKKERNQEETGTA